jgi:hypothetical protein
MFIYNKDEPMSLENEDLEFLKNIIEVPKNQIFNQKITN